MSKDRYDFLPAALEVHETPPHPAARAIIWSIVVFFVIAVAWASIGEIDVVAVAQGKIIPSERVKRIQPLETGVIQQIHVQEGQRVEKGAVLIALDPTSTDADAARLENERLAAKLSYARLRALCDAVAGKAGEPDLSPYLDETLPADRIALHEQILTSQLAEYRARLAGLDSALARRRAERQSTRLNVGRLEKVLPLVSRRADALRGLQKDKLFPEHDYLALEQARIEKAEELAIAKSRIHEIQAEITEAQAQRLAVRAEFQGGALSELQAAGRELAVLEKEYIKAKERNRRQVLHAPVAGVVQQLAVHTVGGVVTPAQELMRIVPQASRLEVEAWLPNKDIGFVEEGQSAEVKVETFPFTKYGIIDAEILDVSNDAVPNEHLGLVYAIRALMQKSVMQAGEKRVNLTPGMAVTVEVKTGKRRLIEFFLSPLLRGMRESVRER